MAAPITPYGGIDRGVLQAIGLAVVNFSQLEEALAFGVNCLIVGTRADDAADLMLRQLSFRSLLDTFSGLYLHRFGSDDAAELKLLCNRLDALNNKRNHLIHSFWTPADANDKLSRYRKAMRRGGPKIWDDSVSESDILDFAKRTDTAYSDVLEIVIGRVLKKIDKLIPPGPA